MPFAKFLEWTCPNVLRMFKISFYRMKKNVFYITSKSTVVNTPMSV